MMEMVVKIGAISRTKLQSNHRHQPAPNFLQAGCPSCRPTNSVKALKVIDLLWTCHFWLDGDRSFAVIGLKHWNTLPEDITSTPSLLVFWRKLKTQLFRQSYPRTISCSLSILWATAIL